MSKYIYVISAFFCLFLLSTLNGFASSADMVESYKDRQSQGYWFYDDPEPIEETIPPELLAPPTPEPAPPQPKKEIKKPEPKNEKIELTVDWITENLPKFRKNAIDNPSPDNVRAYFYLQRLMLDKSQRFADAAQQVLLTDPLLDENTRRPTATFGGTEKNREAEQVMDDLFSKLSNRVGLWFFFRQEEMAMDMQQASVLTSFEQTTGIHVQAISIDGSILPGNEFENIKQDRGQSDQLKIIQTPALFLVNPSTKQIAPLSQSLLALPDLKRRALLASVQADWITETDFHKTRGMRSDITLESTPVIRKSDLDQPKNLADKLEKLLIRGLEDEL